MALPIFLLDSLQEQALQQAHDLLDTIQVITDTAKQKREILAEAPVMEWHGIDEDEKPLDGERVVIDTGAADPYFATYFASCGFCRNDVKRWIRLPE